MRRLTARGRRVAVVKHMRHDFEADREGKDTYRYRQAGSVISAITNGTRMALMADVPPGSMPQELAPSLFDAADLIIVEGNKESAGPKIEVMGDSAEKPLYLSGITEIVALVCDRPLDADLPCFRRDDVEGVERFILRFLAIEGDEGGRQ